MNMFNDENIKDISTNEILIIVKNVIRNIKNKRLLILSVAVLGGLAGLAYSLFKKPVYSAECTFVIDDGNKQGALGQFAGLASLTGLGSTSSGGVFQEENILELYKSRAMIAKTLLTSVYIDGKNQLLIDRYLAYNKIREKWKQKHISDIEFTGDPAKFDRIQDSVITNISLGFNKNGLTVEKPDKKVGVIKVEFDSPDELFAKEFTNTLVENVSEFYIETTTKKSLLNVRILQHQADSVRSVLNSLISGIASSIDAAPNANPLQNSLRVPSQRKQVDVQASTAVYAEIVKNLEIAKISLRQEMPLIQIIDKPILPLVKTKIGKIKGIILGAFIALFILIVGIFIKKSIAVLADVP